LLCCSLLRAPPHPLFHSSPTRRSSDLRFLLDTISLRDGGSSLYSTRRRNQAWPESEVKQQAQLGGVWLFEPGERIPRTNREHDFHSLVSLRQSHTISAISESPTRQ